jgi:hypothetical protein
MAGYRLVEAGQDRQLVGHSKLWLTREVTGVTEGRWSNPGENTPKN